jgi:hypothetical protein
MLAAQGGHVAVMEELLGAGTDLQYVSPVDGYTVWHQAVNGGNAEVSGTRSLSWLIRLIRGVVCIVWVRVEIMGSHTCGIVGKSLSVLSMIDPMISPRPRRWRSCFIEWTVHGRASPRGFSRRGSSSRW